MSVKVAPEMLAVFGFVRVMVSVLVPLAAIVEGLKLFATVGAARTKFTVGRCEIVTLPDPDSVATAVYVTSSTVASLTVKVATPALLVSTGEVEIIELPPAAVNVTEIPLPAVLPFARLTVTVMVDVATPFASTVVGLATAVDFDA